ncbi:MAG TPA: hypothetical protein PKE31_15175 [Pseudomonadota bacterium]|nr:hypothetical protein [Pseudomonadota bacterium]
MRKSLWFFCYFLGCVVYEDEVLTSRDLRPAEDARSDGQGGSPGCVVEDVNAAMCQEAWRWVDWAAQTCCRSTSPILRAVSFASVCPAETDFSTRGITYECCRRTEPVPPPLCQPDKFGGDCLSEEEWKLRAMKQCASKGRLPTPVRFPPLPCKPKHYPGVSFECCILPCRVPTTFRSLAADGEGPAPEPSLRVPPS